MTEINKKALEQTAFNLCSLHGFAPEFVAEQERFATAVIVEYCTAIQEAERIEPVKSALGGEVVTLRDMFAMTSLEAMIGNESKENSHRGANGLSIFPRFAYEWADAMLEARK